MADNPETKKVSSKISIIIPAYNEEQYIGALLKSIYDGKFLYDYEVIVVDNGSTDRTREIIKKTKAKLIAFPEGYSISAVRNKGVKESSSEILVFLDADIIVMDSWHNNISETVQHLYKDPNIITGSRCLAENNIDWLNRYWFTLLNTYSAPYINSGHLITTRQLFNKIGGFTEHLQTAEDYDFCMKAQKIGAQLIENNALQVIHKGYPKTIIEFINRERWQGKEDFLSFQSIKESKMAWISIIHVMIFVLCLFGFMLTLNISYILMFIIVIYSISILLSIYKFGTLSILNLLNTAAIFSLYLLGRTLALFDKLSELVLNTK